MQRDGTRAMTSPYLIRDRCGLFFAGPTQSGGTKWVNRSDDATKYETKEDAERVADTLVGARVEESSE